jgi:hypothetical protein
MLTTYFLYLLIGLGGGILAARWIPSFHFTDADQFLVTLVLDPFSFFFGMLCFFIGFLANAKLIKNCIEQTYALIKGVHTNFVHMSLSYLVFCSFIGLFFINISVAIVFLIFSVIYGMISLDLNRYMIHDKKQKEL